MRRSSSVFQKTSPRVVLFLTLAGVFLLFTLVYGSQSFRAQLVPDTATAAFRAFDEDQNGVIENNEAIYGWSGFKQAINSSPAASSPLKKWDIDSSGRVDFGDMSAIAQVVDQGHKKPVIDLFNIIDTDGDGLLSASELSSSSIEDEHTLMAMFLGQTTCGDGIIEPTGVDRITGNADDEQCDDGNTENADSCSNTCKAPRCGDSIVQAAGMDGNLTTIADNESCDLGDLNSNTGTCTLSCKISRCGDGFQQGAEQCDDGNTENADACTNTCTSPRCGDSIVQTSEQCDDGNTTNEDSCTNTCVSPRCGDAIVQSGEQCDDGNEVNTDTCTVTCVNAVCGDGFQQGTEQCDDGNPENADTCTNTCTSPRCGDAVIQSGEQCDDGNAVNTDACTNNCVSPRCGDAIVQSPEQCDDGNTNNTDSCANTCQSPRCGDTIVQTGEQCDDGNTVNTDTCTSTCTSPRCGDAIVQSGEQCDDGNTNNADSCTNACTIFVAPSSSSSSMTSSVSSSLHGAGPNVPPLVLDLVKYSRTVEVRTEAEFKAFMTRQTPNTIVRIADGTYELSKIVREWPNNQGLRVEKPYIAFVGQSKDPTKVIINGFGMASPNKQPSFGLVTNQTGSVFAHLTIQNVRLHAIKVEGAEGVIIYNVIAKNAGEQIVKINQTVAQAEANQKVLNGRIEYSEFSYDNYPAYNYINGIDALGAKNWVVRNNILRNIRVPATEAAVAPNPGFPKNPAAAILFWNGAEDVIVENNTIMNSDRGIVYGLGQVKAPVSRGTIRNNVIIRTEEGVKPDASIVMENAYDVSVVHNTIYQVGAYSNAIEYRFPTTSKIVIKNTIANKAITNRNTAEPAAMAGNVTNAAASWFTNLQAGDAHLTTLAVPAHNTAVVLTPSFPDHDGTPRSATPDVGAYESSFVTSSSPASSAASSIRSSIVSSSTSSVRSSIQSSARIACGDSIVQPNGVDGMAGTSDDEQCDDGNNGIDTDGCNNNCKLVPLPSSSSIRSSSSSQAVSFSSSSSAISSSQATSSTRSSSRSSSTSSLRPAAPSSASVTPRVYFPPMSNFAVPANTTRIQSLTMSGPADLALEWSPLPFMNVEKTGAKTWTFTFTPSPENVGENFVYLTLSANGAKTVRTAFSVYISDPSDQGPLQTYQVEATGYLPTQALITWDINKPKAETSILFHKNNEPDTVQHIGTRTQFSLTNLAPDTQYTFKLRSQTGSEIFLSAPYTLRTPANPTAVTGLQAMHRSGQTFLTWNETASPTLHSTPSVGHMRILIEILKNTGSRYLVYRSSSPISSVTGMTPVIEVLPLNIWNTYFYGENPATFKNSAPRYVITNAGEPLNLGTGLAVFNANEDTRSYYAIVYKNGTQLTAPVSLANPVEETRGTGTPILQRSFVLPLTFAPSTPSPRQYFYTRWEYAPMSSSPLLGGMWKRPELVRPFDYMVAVPENALHPAPAYLALHWWSGNLMQQYQGWMNGEYNGSIMVSGNQVPYSFWTGYKGPDGKVHAYQQTQMLSFLDWAKQQPQFDIDPSRIFIGGASMGGSGAPSIAIRNPERFSWVFAGVGIKIPKMSTHFAGTYAAAWSSDVNNASRDPQFNNVLFEDDTPVWDYFDDEKYLRSHPTIETPYIFFANGTNDEAISWPQAVRFAKTLIDTKRPFSFNWYDGGHQTLVKLPNTESVSGLASRLMPLDIRNDQAVPAFRNGSLDDNPGDGTLDTEGCIPQANAILKPCHPVGGVIKGQINAYYVWETTDTGPDAIVDTPTRFEMTIKLLSTTPSDNATVDMTPRRVQQFRVNPGTVVSYTATPKAGGTAVSNTVTADENGLVTLERLPISKAGTRIVINAPQLSFIQNLNTVMQKMIGSITAALLGK